MSRERLKAVCAVTAISLFAARCAPEPIVVGPKPTLSPEPPKSASCEGDSELANTIMVGEECLKERFLACSTNEGWYIDHHPDGGRSINFQSRVDPNLRPEVDCADGHPDGFLVEVASFDPECFGNKLPGEGMEFKIQ